MSNKSYAFEDPIRWERDTDTAAVAARRTGLGGRGGQRRRQGSVAARPNFPRPYAASRFSKYAGYGKQNRGAGFFSGHRRMMYGAVVTRGT